MTKEGKTRKLELEIDEKLKRYEKPDKINERIEYLLNLSGILKRKYIEDKELDSKYRINMLTLAIFQIEPAIMEIKLLDDKNAEKLKATKFELEELSKMFTTETFKLKKEVHRESKPNWLQVGILFATGEIDLNDKTANFTAIARKFFNEEHSSYRPYISSSINNTVKSDKNIFYSTSKMLEILNECRERNIEPVDAFIEKFKRLE